MENTLFAVEHESFLISMVTERFVGSSFNPEVDSEAQEFLDFHVNALQNSKWSIPLGDGYTFLSRGISLNLAQSLFGKAVCNTEQTKQVIAYLVIEKLGEPVLGFDFVVEAIDLNREFKTSEDIISLIDEVVEIVKQWQKNQTESSMKQSVI